MRVYEYTDDSWYDNACDCCPATLMSCYNLLNDVDQYTYSCHTEEDCYRQCLELEGIIDDSLELDYNEIDFKLLCTMNNICVVIHYDDLENF